MSIHLQNSYGLIYIGTFLYCSILVPEVELLYICLYSTLNPARSSLSQPLDLKSQGASPGLSG